MQHQYKRLVLFSTSKIQQGLIGLVGFRQPFNQLYAKLDVANQISRSALYVNDNPICKVEYIYDSADFSEQDDAQFNTMLTTMQQTSVVNVMRSVFNEVDLLDSLMIKTGEVDKFTTDVLPIGFIGYKLFDFDNTQDISVNIGRVNFDFNGAGTITLMLLSTASTTPIYTKVVNITSTHQVEQLNWVIDRSNDSVSQVYYIGYVNDVTTTLLPQSTSVLFGNIIQQPKHLFITPIVVNGHLTNDLFNHLLVDWLGTSTGFNFHVSVYNDYTNFILQNEILFANAILLDLQIACLTQYLASLRSNENQRNSNASAIDVRQQIEGESGAGMLKVQGLRPKLLGSINEIKNEIMKLKGSNYNDNWFNSVTL